MKYSIIILMAFILLTGCNTDPIKVTTEAVKKSPIVLPSVDKFSATEFTWIIVTKDNIDEIFKMLAKKGDKLALFSLTGRGYKALSTNTADTLTLILQLQAQIEAYKKYYIVVPKPKKESK